MKKAKTASASGRSYLIDACVIIDYQKTENLELLGLFGRHCGSVLVSSYTPGPEGEVLGFTSEDCARLGIGIVTPTLDQLERATSRPRPSRVAFNDAVHVVSCEDSGAVLVTNDRALRKMASERSVECIGGLRIMSMLVSSRKLPKDRAARIASEVVRSNSYMDAKILGRFYQEIGVDPANLVAAPIDRSN
jgi:hypothetical protein